MSGSLSRTSRRRFLKAAGVSIALPVFDSLAPRRARAHGGEVRPQRLVVIGHPNGTTQEPGSAEIPEGLLARLAPVEGRYSLIKNINNHELKYPQINTGVGTPHSGCFHGFLSGQIHPGVGDERQTVDQLLAADPLHQGASADSISINVGKRPTSTSGVPQEWFNTWAWKGPAQPVAAYHDPRALFELLFAGLEPPDNADARARLEKKQLYLDAVLDQVQDLRPRLNHADKNRLDEYLTGVEELDRKTAGLLDGGGLLECTIPQAPDIDLNPDSVAVPLDLYPEVLTMMQDLIVTAFMCDATRLVTFAHASPAGGGSVTRCDFVEGFEGVQKGWHPLSHWNSPYGTLSEDQALNRRDFERVLSWHYDRVVEFVQKLDNVVDTDGRSLLDDSLVCFGSWQGAAIHGPERLYQIFFGSGGDRFKLGEEIHVNPGDSNGDKSIADVWLSVLRGFGQDQDSFGMGSSGVDEMLA